MLGHEYDAAIAAFIRTKGVTRCPTACALPTQATIATRDRTAFEEHAANVKGCVDGDRLPRGNFPASIGFWIGR
jgi:hypothetical protein